MDGLSRDLILLVRSEMQQPDPGRKEERTKDEKFFTMNNILTC